MRFPKVSIIILNWNGWRNTLECLESLYRIVYPNYEVIVVDNGSKDQSVKMIKKWVNGKADKKFFILENDNNYGFTRGNNIAINQILKEKKSDYILLLNNDTVVSKEFLTELIKAAESDASIGIVGPKLYYYNYNNRKDVIQSAGAKINLYTGRFINYGDKQIDRKQFDNIRAVDHICGACLLIKREVINKIGLLDEKFFAYFEDVDWSLKTKRRGYKIIYIPNSIIWHKGGESLSNAPEVSEYYNARNLFWIEKRYMNSYQFIFFLCYYFLFRFPKRIIYDYFSKKRFSMLKNFLDGLKDGLFGDLRSFVD